MNATSNDGRLRLTILGGYLGSGKTTWLRHKLFEGTFGRAHILVNEAAETPVDDTLLSAQAAGLTMLSGGCACCTGKAELVAALRDLCDMRSRQPAKDRSSDQIVLETSGLADPAAIASAIREDGILAHHIRVVELIVLVDVLHGTEQLRTEKLGRVQIEAADRIVLTKADAVPEALLAKMAATVAQLNPASSIESAVKGQSFSMENIGDVDPMDLPDMLGDTAPLVPTRVDISQEVDWATFSVWLSALLHARGHDLVRVKGVFETPAGPLLLQAVRKSVQPPELLPPEASQRQNQIVFIGRGYDPADLASSITNLTKD